MEEPACAGDEEEEHCRSQEGDEDRSLVAGETREQAGRDKSTRRHGEKPEEPDQNEKKESLPSKGLGKIARREPNP